MRRCALRTGPQQEIMSPEQIGHARRLSQSGIHTPHDAERVATIAVVGLGRSGLPLAIRSATRGLRTIGFDTDEVTVAQLERREARFLREEEADAFRRVRTLSLT